MSSSNSSSSDLGTILSGVLVVFIVLKLAHVINWSWWVVLTPLWVGIVFALLAFIVIVTAVLVTGKVK